MIELPSQQKNNFFVLHARVPIFWFKVVYHHTNFVLKAQRPAKKLTIDLRPTYHPIDIGQNSDFSNVGQMPLGRPLMVLVGRKVVCNASIGCLGVPGVDFG